jgi:3-dehydroquinate dehydratase-2
MARSHSLTSSSASPRARRELGAEVRAFQSNHEGAIIDFIQQESAAADAIIINGGALTHYGLSLATRQTAGIPATEVHISIFAREPFRRRSVRWRLSSDRRRLAGAATSPPSRRWSRW